jgi:hypothetical protein
MTCNQQNGSKNPVDCTHFTSVRKKTSKIVHPSASFQTKTGKQGVYHFYLTASHLILKLTQGQVLQTPRTGNNYFTFSWA